MRINEVTGGSCTTAAIQALSESRDARDAMLAFCKLALFQRTGKYSFAIRNAKEFLFLTTYYVFTTGPKNAGFGSWVNYGDEFADFIVQNHLGVVTTPGEGANHKYEAGRSCQAWLWMPDYDAVVSWWKKNQPKTRVKKEST